MAKDKINQKPIGSFCNSHGRWGWLVKLPGDEKRRMISLVPPGQKWLLNGNLITSQTLGVLPYCDIPRSRKDYREAGGKPKRYQLHIYTSQKQR